MGDLEQLKMRLKDVIHTRCNTVGCDNCDLKWKEQDKEKCSATELDGKIWDIELQPIQPPNPS